MNDRRKTVTLYAKIALILYLIRFCLSLLIELFPAPVLSLLGGQSSMNSYLAQFSPLLRFVPPLCAAAIFLVCWYLVTASVKSNTKESAQTALIVILAVLVINPVATVLGGSAIRMLIVRISSAAAYGAYSLLKTAEGYASLISGISWPLLVAAAAVNRYRFED